MYGRGKKLNKSEEDDYCLPKSENSFWNNNFIEYESNVDKNKNLFLEKYLEKLDLT